MVLTRRRRVFRRRESFRDLTTETYGPRGIPVPREARSSAQATRGPHAHGFRKDGKIKTHKKYT